MQNTPQNQLLVSRRESLTIGIIFFLFSLTLYIYIGQPFELVIWKWTWHAPELVSAIMNVIQILVLIIGSVVSVFCLIGAFFPNWANSLLNVLASHRRLLRLARSIFVGLFPIAFLLNFFVSWIPKLAGVAKNEVAFFIVFAIGLIWAWAITHNR